MLIASRKIAQRRVIAAVAVTTAITLLAVLAFVPTVDVTRAIRPVAPEFDIAGSDPASGDRALVLVVRKGRKSLLSNAWYELTNRLPERWEPVRSTDLERDAEAYRSNRDNDDEVLVSHQSAWTTALRLSGLSNINGTIVSKPGGPLRVGDGVVKVNGLEVKSVGVFRNRIRDVARMNSLIDLEYIRTGTEMRTSIKFDEATLESLMGVQMFPSAGFRDVGIPSMARVHGPSAGLALSLSYLDAITPGDLFAAKTVAATGEVKVMSSISFVDNIDGLAQKISAAERAGVEVVFVPKAQLREAQVARTTSAMTIVGVNTVEAAITWLCESGGASTACENVSGSLCRCASKPVHMPYWLERYLKVAVRQ
jgi:hypothetical protein